MAKFDAYEHLKIVANPDGTLQRLLGIPKKSANPNPPQGEVASKDITINSEKKLYVRVYRPPNNDSISVSKLPLFVFFPGGGWIDQSVQDVFFHEWSMQYCKEVPSVVVSVNYRMAPEHRLPAQYEDGMDVIKWIQTQAMDPNGEKWLKDHVDFKRLYLAGRASGANLAYNVALRLLDHDVTPLDVCGAILNQPMFGGKKRTRSELKYACDEILPLPCWDLYWELALPKGVDRDHRYSNPMLDQTQHNKLDKIGKCLVFGYGMDPGIDRQQDFVTMLVRNGAKVEAHFDDVGFHGIDLVDPKRCFRCLHLVKDFVN